MKRFLSGILASSLVLSMGTVSFAVDSSVYTDTTPAYTQTLSTSPEEDFTIGDGGVITGYTGEGGNVVIPSSIGGRTVYGIGAKAFQNKTNIDSVVMPSTLERIEEFAFDGCTNLRNVTLNEGLEYLGLNSFAGTTNLRDIWIPSTVVELGQGVFYQSGLTSAYVPETVKIVGPFLFQKCERLTSVIFMADIDELPHTIFHECVMLEDVYLTEGIITIGISAFYGCSGLKEITLPSSIKTIDNNAFLDCTKLEKLDLSNTQLTRIGYQSFYKCASLTEVILPYGFLDFVSYDRTYNPDSFKYCTSLKKIVIPSTCTSFNSVGSHLATLSNCHADLKIYGYDGTLAETYANGYDYIGFSSLGSVSSEPQPTIVPTTPPTLPTAPSATTPEVTTPTPEVTTPEVTTPTTPEVSTAKIATPSTAKVMVNGAEVPFGAYNIDGYNYFKLTDIAYSIHGTAKQFNVGWDSSANAIGISLNQGHTLLGTELEANSGKNETADLFQSPIFCDGTQVYPTAYIINGSSYFQLNALIDIVGITVGWDGATSTITITT